MAKFQKKKGFGANNTSSGAAAGGAPTAPNNGMAPVNAGQDGGKNWVKQALAGTYQFNTGGADKMGKRPGFGKAGAASMKQDKKMKGAIPTHGSDGAC